MTKKYLEIPVSQIKPDPNQPRQQFDEVKLKGLADSIKEHGVLQPIEVSLNGDGRYMIHHGERRWRAAQLAGLETMPVIVAPSQADDDRLIKQVVENLQRADMLPIDMAKAYQRLMDAGMTQMELSRKLGKAQATIAAHVIWLQLEPEIQDLVNRKLISKDKRVSAALLGIPDSDARVKLAQRISRSRLPIKAIVVAANKVADKLKQSHQFQTNNTVPSLRLNRRLPKESATVPRGDVRSAAKAMCAECFNLPLTQLNEPAWALVVKQANTMCEKCEAWEPGDNLIICQECPGVKLIGALIKGVNRGY